MTALDLVIVGAGQSGLALARQAQVHGLRYRALERHDRVQGQWRDHYDSLRLFSPARYSSLEGLPFPKPPDSYPTKEEVAQYLSAYSSHFALHVQIGCEVERIARVAEGFEVETPGETLRSRSVALAVGAYTRPFIPEIAGADAFSGRVLHAQQYRNPQPFLEQDVLVVGGGNSAVQIAHELSKHARVFLATRGRLRFVPNPVLGHDVIFWTREVLRLEYLNLPLRLSEPIIDTKHARRDFESGKIQHLPMFLRFVPGGVRWADGRELRVDSVIFATGYRPDLGVAGDLIQYDTKGFPVHAEGVIADEPGLFLMGMHRQRNFSSATLRGTDDDARALIRHVFGHVSARSDQAT